MTLLSLFFSVLSAPAHAEGGPGAIDAFRQSHQRLTALVAKGASSKVRAAEVDALLDYSHLALQAIGGQANCGSRCSAYIEEVRSDVRGDWMQALYQQRGSVTYLGEQAVGGSVRVSTRVQTSKKTMHIDYLLHEVGGRWKVHDIVNGGAGVQSALTGRIGALYTAGGIDRVMSKLQAPPVK